MVSKDKKFWSILLLVNIIILAAGLLAGSEEYTEDESERIANRIWFEIGNGKELK